MQIEQQYIAQSDFFQVVHSDDSGKKKAPPPNVLGPRKRASTLGVIAEQKSIDDTQQTQKTEGPHLRPPVLVEKQRLPSSGSSGSLDGLSLHVVAGRNNHFFQVVASCQ